MSSTNKTEHLSLNKWLGTDRPQRIDFVDDNVKIDTAIKNHVNNTTMHFTSGEKAKLGNPFTFTSYVGTGSATQEITLSFEPKLAIIFTKDEPIVQTDSNGAVLTNFAILAKANGTSGGAVMRDSVITVYQQTAAQNGIMHNLNKRNGQYCIVAFK